jgi:hypothetical protein
MMLRWDAPAIAAAKKRTEERLKRERARAKK